MLTLIVLLCMKTYIYISLTHSSIFKSLFLAWTMSGVCPEDPRFVNLQRIYDADGQLVDFHGEFRSITNAATMVDFNTFRVDIDWTDYAITARPGLDMGDKFVTALQILCAGIIGNVSALHPTRLRNPEVADPEELYRGPEVHGRCQNVRVDCCGNNHIIGYGQAEPVPDRVDEIVAISHVGEGQSGHWGFIKVNKRTRTVVISENGALGPSFLPHATRIIDHNNWNPQGAPEYGFRNEEGRSQQSWTLEYVHIASEAEDTLGCGPAACLAFVKYVNDLTGNLFNDIGLQPPMRMRHVRAYLLAVICRQIYFFGETVGLLELRDPQPNIGAAPGYLPAQVVAYTRNALLPKRFQRSLTREQYQCAYCHESVSCSRQVPVGSQARFVALLTCCNQNMHPACYVDMIRCHDGANSPTRGTPIICSYCNKTMSGVVTEPTFVMVARGMPGHYMRPFAIHQLPNTGNHDSMCETRLQRVNTMDVLITMYSQGLPGQANAPALPLAASDVPIANFRRERLPPNGEERPSTRPRFEGHADSPPHLQRLGYDSFSTEPTPNSSSTREIRFRMPMTRYQNPPSW